MDHHQARADRFVLPLRAADVTVSDTLGGAAIVPEDCEGGILLPADNRRYLKTALPREAVIAAFADAKPV